MTALLRTEGLGKRYGRRWALSDCTLDVPAGHVVGLVGPNGAGKTTLLNMAAGQTAPSAGTIRVLGGVPGAGPAQLARVGYVAQQAPTYAGLTVADHLRLGARLNPRWDASLARDRVTRLGLDPRRRAGRLSGGQRAQLALTLGIAKRPELLILDEPVSSLDPLARREFLQALMEAAAEQELSVLLSSHLLSDLERTCDYLIVLADAHVRLAGEVEHLLATHHRLTGPRRDPATLPSGQHVVSASHTDRQTTLVVRTEDPVHDPSWTVASLSLEDLVLAYMARPTSTPSTGGAGDPGGMGRGGGSGGAGGRAGGAGHPLDTLRAAAPDSTGTSGTSGTMNAGGATGGRPVLKVLR
ncbi:ABC transporter ATP-binding protein [Sphaerisporangium sp. B11E5]|uniref:ABC transporter ATP-binding protein n=1 Tax=Sphaerisporangium sp. B11E5 TaxID=3153563 RepID=UPI00325F669A